MEGLRYERIMPCGCCSNVKAELGRSDCYPPIEGVEISWPGAEPAVKGERAGPVCECSRCGGDVALEEEVDGCSWVEGTRVVTDVSWGPAIGACCELLYVEQPDGRIEVLG